MKFILIDSSAARRLASERVLQSTEFSQGADFAELLKGGSPFPKGLPGVKVARNGDGLYLLAGQAAEPSLVFDLVATELFVGFSGPDVLTIFQKTLRLAIRLWDNLRLSAAEHPVPDSNKVALFPFPISTQDGFRLTLERNPDAERIALRGPSNNLLVFRAGEDEGGGPREQPVVARFRAAVDGLGQARSTCAGMAVRSTECEANGPLAVVQLIDRPIFPRQTAGLEHWLPILTTTQRAFVQHPLVGGERLEGPAGTGKTLSLVLRCIHCLKSAEETGTEHHSIFFTHGDATEVAVRQLIRDNDPVGFLDRERQGAAVSLSVTTLQKWCAEKLASGISPSEYLDQDAMEAKELRLLYVAECVDHAMAEDFQTHRAFLSDRFASFLATEDRWVVTEMVQHEIAVMIKGRAQEDQDTYLRLPSVRYNLPLEVPADKAFVFTIYKRYHEQLKAIAQFDTDDIVLSAIGQLHTPIWRRRRLREGYDSIFIDETHLFNINELSVFHFLTRDPAEHKIVFSVDRSQAVGDRDLSSAILEETILSREGETPPQARGTRMNSVFRCSPQITELALSITASGATLFTNFDNPLDGASSLFTEEEERKARMPTLSLFLGEDAMVSEAFSRAEQMTRDLDCSRSAVAIIAFAPTVLDLLEKHAAKAKKPVELLKTRGDIDVIRKAYQGGRFVMGLADYCGGLEFQGVVLVGVDDGRVPPAAVATTSESRHFLSFAYHNKLYVAVTRARFLLEVLGEKGRGVSPILTPALSRGLLIEQ